LTTLRSQIGMALTICGVLAGAARPAQASVVTLNGTGTMATPSFQFLDPTGSANVLADNATTYALAVPGQYLYSDQFSAAQANPLLGTSAPGTYGFQDSIEFALNAPASGDILTSTLNLGNLFNISGLQIRLYGWTTGSPTVPTVGALPAGTVSYAPWIGIPTGQSTVMVNFGDVPAGTYMLDITGTATGVPVNGTGGGGSYIGQLNVSPIPLPGAFALLLSGLGLFGIGGLGRRMVAPIAI